MPIVATEAKSQNPGHDNCAPVKFHASQAIVKVNGSPILVVGDTSDGHSCGKPYEHPYHTSQIAAGSGIVFINGKPVARQGDQISGCPMPVSVNGGDGLVNISS